MVNGTDGTPEALSVMIPLRVGPELVVAAYVNVVVPLPPDPPDGIVSHVALASTDALHADTLVAVTVAVPVCEALVIDAVVGEMVKDAAPA